MRALFRPALRLSVGAFLVSAFFSARSFAGIIEISGEGSFYRFNSSESSYTQTYGYAASIAYHFFSVTAIELSYSRSVEQQVVENINGQLYGQTVTTSNVKTKFDVYSVSLVQYLMSRKNAFQPFIRVGAGYVYQTVSVIFDYNTGGKVTFDNIIKRQGMSGNLGLGFNIRFTENLYLKVNGTLYGTELDKDRPLLHYTLTGGLAVAF